MRSKMSQETLSEYVKLVIESQKIREADTTDGKVPWGSQAHIDDLNRRIADLSSWRNKQPRGSAARENYSRLIGRLKSELKSATRIASRQEVSQ